MLRLVARRLITAVPVVLGVSIAIFLLVRLVPGGPAEAVAGQNSSPEQIERLNAQMGLDEPMLSQYVDWLSGAVRGDLGTSLFSSQSVTTAIVDRLPPTLSLTISATVLALLLGVPAGVLAALRPGSLLDRGITALASAGLAVPGFWLALVLIAVFVNRLDWFPPTGYIGLTEGIGDWARTIALPSVALAAAAGGVIARQTRSALIDVLDADFIIAARARGLGRRRVVLTHGLRNASIPVITILGLQIVSLLGGSVIIEQVFAIQGVGTLALNSVSLRDFTMIQGIVVVTSIVVVVVNCVVDILYAVVNPRAT